MEDELRPEYDLMSLKVRKVGPERKSFYGTTVRLETDVAKVFPDSGSVNEALRFLIRVIFTDPVQLLFVSFLDIKRDAFTISPGLGKPVTPAGNFTEW